MARTTRQLKILNGAALTESLDLGSGKLMGVHLPAALDGTKLTMQVSTDGSAWQDLYSAAGNVAGGSEWEQPIAAGRAYPLDGWIQTFSRLVRFRTGSSGSPSNQSAERLIAVVMEA